MSYLYIIRDNDAFMFFLTSSVVGEFGRIALEFLRRGASPKVYEGAASKTLHLLVLLFKLM